MGNTAATCRILPSLSSEPPLPGTGDQIGPYQLVEQLDDSGITQLFHARRPSGNRQPLEVAIRVAVDPIVGAHAVEAEHQALSRLLDPRVPAIQGFWPVQGALALTWVAGVELAVILASRDRGQLGVPPATAVDIALEAGRAAAQAEVVLGGREQGGHGRIDPHHLRLSPDGRVWVTGYGRPAGKGQGPLPPEQAAGAFTDARSDQWAVAALAVDLLLGAPLYAGAKSPQSMMERGEVEPWVQRISGQLPELGKVLRRMLDPAAGRRFPTTREAVTALEEAARSLPGTPEPAALFARHAQITGAAERRRVEIGGHRPSSSANATLMPEEEGDEDEEEFAKTTIVSTHQLKDPGPRVTEPFRPPPRPPALSVLAEEVLVVEEDTESHEVTTRFRPGESDLTETYAPPGESQLVDESAATQPPSGPEAISPAGHQGPEEKEALPLAPRPAIQATELVAAAMIGLFVLVALIWLVSHFA